MKLLNKKNLLTSFFLIFAVFSTTLFFSNSFCAGQEEECFICFDDKPGERMITLPCCHKKLHGCCMNQWYQASSNKDCPHCRTKLKRNLFGSYSIENGTSEAPQAGQTEQRTERRNRERRQEHNSTQRIEIEDTPLIILIKIAVILGLIAYSIYKNATESPAGSDSSETGNPSNNLVQRPHNESEIQTQQTPVNV